MPVNLSVDVRFAVSIPRDPEIMAWMRQAMQKSMNQLKRRAEQNLSGRFLKVRSGKGLRSLRTRIRQGRDELVGTVGSPVFYLRILHTGFPAQQLTVRRGKGFFTFNRGGQIIRSKTIQHPGVAPRPWLQNAMEESRDDILTNFSEVTQQIARFMGRGSIARAA